MLVLVTILYTIATFFLAYYACKDYQAAEAERKAAEDFRSQLNDLYQAIAIATLISAGPTDSHMPLSITNFRKHYQGRTQILPD